MISAPLLHRTLSALVHKFAGRPAVVMGGAPSLPHDLAVLRERGIGDAVYLSVNEHGLLPSLENAPAEVHFAVACDGEHGATRMPMEKVLRPFGKPIIAPKYWADYRVLHHAATNSAILACLAAWAMGCAPIVITGVEMYRGKTYWHDPKARPVGTMTPPQQHAKRWQMVPQILPQAMLRSVSGPLNVVMRPWIPDEPITPIAPTNRILGIIGGTWVEITRNCDWPEKEPQTRYAAGEIIETKTHEAGLMIARRFARSRPRGHDSEIIEIDEYS